jgi:hypothetical protein
VKYVQEIEVLIKLSSHISTLLFLSDLINTKEFKTPSTTPSLSRALPPSCDSLTTFNLKPPPHTICMLRVKTTISFYYIRKSEMFPPSFLSLTPCNNKKNSQNLSYSHMQIPTHFHMLQANNILNPLPSALSAPECKPLLYTLHMI